MTRASRNRRHSGTAGLGIVVATAMIGLSTPAHATSYNEGPVQYRETASGSLVPYEANDLSSNPSSPTNIGALTLGANVISGATIPYGPVSNPMTGERQFQDNDYVSFTIPAGEVLSKLFLLGPSAASGGTVITPGDLFFIGLASGTSVSVTPPSSAGLLGFTLAPASAIGTDILPAIGAASPPGFSGPPFSGATTFTGALGAGTYSLWLLDGDNPVSYSLDLEVATSPAPEPATWAMMIAGFALVGVALRRRQKRSTEAAFA